MRRKALLLAVTLTLSNSVALVAEEPYTSVADQAPASDTANSVATPMAKPIPDRTIDKIKPDIWVVLTPDAARRISPTTGVAPEYPNIFYSAAALSDKASVPFHVLDVQTGAIGQAYAVEVVKPADARARLEATHTNRVFDANDYRAMGLIELADRNYAVAIALFDQSLSIDPKNSLTYYYRGFANNHLPRESLVRALGDLTESIRLASSFNLVPRPYWAYLERAAVFETEKRYDRAVTDFNTVLGMKKDDATAADGLKRIAAQLKTDADKEEIQSSVAEALKSAEDADTSATDAEASAMAAEKAATRLAPPSADATVRAKESRDAATESRNQAHLAKAASDSMTKATTVNDAKAAAKEAADAANKAEDSAQIAKSKSDEVSQIFITTLGDQAGDLVNSATKMAAVVQSVTDIADKLAMEAGNGVSAPGADMQAAATDAENANSDAQNALDDTKYFAALVRNATSLEEAQNALKSATTSSGLTQAAVESVTKSVKGGLIKTLKTLVNSANASRFAAEALFKPTSDSLRAANTALSITASAGPATQIATDHFSNMQTAVTAARQSATDASDALTVATSSADPDQWLELLKKIKAAVSGAATAATLAKSESDITFLASTESTQAEEVRAKLETSRAKSEKMRAVSEQNILKVQQFRREQAALPKAAP